jgi:hypothetical protein
MSGMFMPWPPRSKETKSLIWPAALPSFSRQHIKGLGELPILSNITLKNGQCKFRTVKILNFEISL